MAVMATTIVTGKGTREVLGCDIGYSESAHADNALI